MRGASNQDGVFRAECGHRHADASMKGRPVKDGDLTASRNISR
jgi:hypothetical protein